MTEKDQLCYLISGIMRRMYGIPLDKDAKQSFKYMSPENCAEKGHKGLRKTATETENRLCMTLPPSTNSVASQPLL